MVQVDGVRVRTERVARGMSQLELADAAEVRQATVSNVENGKSCRPSTVRKIAAVFGVQIAELLK